MVRVALSRCSSDFPGGPSAHGTMAKFDPSVFCDGRRKQKGFPAENWACLPDCPSRRKVCAFKQAVLALVLACEQHQGHADAHHHHAHPALYGNLLSEQVFRAECSDYIVKR